MRKCTTQWFRIDRARHSVCGSAEIRHLDFKHWWEDPGGTFFGMNRYLHVVHKDGETWHRVHPNRRKCGAKPRLGMRKGILHWIKEARRG